MLTVKIITMLISGILDSLGGVHWLFCRRYIMPIILGISCAYICHIWWVMFLTWPAIGTLSIGYSKDGNFGRAIWLGIQAVALGLALTLLAHLTWWFFVPYVIGAFVLGGLYKNWYQPFGDFITGSYLGLIIFLIH